MALMHPWMSMAWTALAPTLKSRAWQADQAAEAKGESPEVVLLRSELAALHSL